LSPVSFFVIYAMNSVASCVLVLVLTSAVAAENGHSEKATTATIVVCPKCGIWASLDFMKLAAVGEMLSHPALVAAVCANTSLMPYEVGTALNAIYEEVVTKERRFLVEYPRKWNDDSKRYDNGYDPDTASHIAKKWRYLTTMDINPGYGFSVRGDGFISPETVDIEKGPVWSGLYVDENGAVVDYATVDKEK
jgi:hypothetical protein